jgi:hypothetical protein
MSKTLSQMVSCVLRNAQIPEDSTTPSLQAAVDAAAFLNERAEKIWALRNWPEFFILGSYTVPANTQRIALSSITPDTGFTTSANGYNATFALAVSLRSGVNNIQAEDPSIIHRVRADLWSNTDTPTSMVNRGQNGFMLLGAYPTATVLNFYGKANFQALTDSETWILGNDHALIMGATADLIKWNDRDDPRSAPCYQEMDAEIQKMIDKVENQMGNIKRIVPQNPWTRSLIQRRDFSRIGINTSR